MDVAVVLAELCCCESAVSGFSTCFVGMSDVEVEEVNDELDDFMVLQYALSRPRTVADECFLFH